MYWLENILASQKLEETQAPQSTQQLDRLREGRRETGSREPAAQFRRSLRTEKVFPFDRC